MKKAGQKIAAQSLRFMNVKLIFSMVVLSLALPSLLCLGAPYNYNSNPTYSNKPAPRADDSQSNSNQMRNTLSELKNEVKNHEIELRTFEGQLQSQENILDTLRQQMNDTLQDHQHDVTAKSVNLEAKYNALDNTVKGLIEDMRQMKNQANDSVTILGQYKQKLSEFERLIDSQNQHMKNLEAGLSSIVEVMQAKEASEKTLTKMSESSSSFSSSGGTYKVQSGDRLEKIARNHKVSVQALRDCNGLKDDRIIVGQTLKIPN